VTGRSKIESNDSLEKIERRVAVVTVLLPFLAVIAAVVLLWGKLVTGVDLLVCALMYLVTGFGITMGFHRLFTHRSFKCASPVSFFLGVAGCMAAQGPILFWTACHRKHHQFSDAEGDPHSPHAFGSGLLALLRGWWHSHTGWMLTHKPENYRRLVGDLIRDRLVMRVNRYYLLWVALGLLIPGVIGGLISQSWLGFGTGILWGGLVRMFLVHHSTWSINSICHLFGKSPFPTGDKSHNNVACALLGLGEGWHNNHHAFPSSARHGLFWWQLDMTYLGVRVLEFCRLAWDVRLPRAHEITQKRQVTASSTAVIPPVKV
jgi:stearoyl-CoA desaturase (Delta-9 desaturase)